MNSNVQQGMLGADIDYESRNSLTQTNGQMWGSNLPAGTSISAGSKEYIRMWSWGSTI